MPGFAEYGDYDGLGLAELVRAKEVTPQELAEEAIARIQRVNPQLNAVIHPLFERARGQLSGQLPEGPFRGVPFLIKDLQAALAGEPHEKGCEFFRGHRAWRNTELVNRYLATGAVVVGKTNTPEFGLMPTTEPHSRGPSRNPWDISRSPGGSSGGSAVAVAARLVPLAGGGDGGGSIRIPASCCGLFGLKPSRGRTPTGPERAEGWAGFAIEHVLTRSVRDSAAMLDATTGHLPGDLHYMPRPERPFLAEVAAEPQGLRIAVSTQPLLPGTVSPECTRAVEDAAALLQELGHEVCEAAPAIDGKAFARAYLTVVASNTWADIRSAEEELGRKATRDDFEPRTWISSRVGAAVSGGEYVHAMQQLQRWAREVHEFSERYDVIVNPTLPTPPQELGFLRAQGALAVAERIMRRAPLLRAVRNTAVFDALASDTFSAIPWTPIYNVTGQPSMSVPLHTSATGLPVGVMFTARLADDALLFRLAGQLERARPWEGRRPPVCA